MSSGRYRPTRAGIINLWDYTDHVFRFEHGWLVLRGPNGSGKTKALEVLFPAVLDGRLDPRRLDPFSGENRTMRENLLYRGDDTAVGYAWMEFCRDGAPDDRVTAGVGVRASRQREGFESWFFCTTQRLGEGFALIDEERRPLLKAKLAESLGRDCVFERARDLRVAVDLRLYGLGARYEALLDLVLTLRRPQLAKDLNPARLSDVLTQGLPPIDEQLIHQVARSFEDMESVQRELARLERSDDALVAFLAAWRASLRAIARHRVDVVRQHETRQEERARALEAARERDAASVAALAVATAALDAAGEALSAARAREAALKDSELYRTALSLGELRDALAREATALEEQQRRSDKAETTLRMEEAELDRLARVMEQRVAAEQDASTRLLAAARDAQIPWTPADLGGEPAERRERVRGRVAARRTAVSAVRVELVKVRDATRKLEEAEDRLLRRDGQVQRALVDLETAARAVEAARAALTEAVARWADAAGAEIATTALSQALHDAVSAIGGPDTRPLPVVYHEQVDGWRERVRAGLDAQRRQVAALEADRDALVAQRLAIASERDDAPPPGPRRTASREGRPGAPFWRVVRFADGLPESQQAGLEAALEASGLLDAWLDPEGRVHDLHDAFLVPGGVADGPSLALLLVPEDEPAVPPDVITRLLRAIPVQPSNGDSPVYVQSDGRWRLGPIQGASQTNSPCYIGVTARIRRRTQRLGALDQQIASQQRAIDAAALDLARWEGRAAALKAADRSLPTDHALRKVLQDAAGREVALSQAQTAAEEARGERDRARAELDRDALALRRVAAAHEAPATVEGIDALQAGIERFAEAGTAILAAQGARADATRAHAQQDERVVQGRVRVDEAVEDLRQVGGRRAALQTRYDTLIEAAGADVGELERRLVEAVRAIEQAKVQERERAREKERRRAEQAEIDKAVAVIASELSQTRDALAGALELLTPLSRPELAAILEITPEFAGAAEANPGELGPLMALSRALHKATQHVSGTDERRKATTTAVNNLWEVLPDALGSSWRPTRDNDGEVQLFSIRDEDGLLPVGAFAARVSARRRELVDLLTRHERELFEDTLLKTLCGEILQRVRGATRLVRSMNDAMRQRRLSSGQTVGISWLLDESMPPEDKAALRLLEIEAEHLGPDALDQIRACFSSRIQGARSRNPSRAYRELLTEVLDYRRWRAFQLRLVRPGQPDVQLNQSAYARLSGGEKAASLHLPLFAAAHALYSSARPDCPRLIALDEAFAGIDDQGRPALLDLAVQFDLDLFMTGYDLWVTSPGVPAAAHYELHHPEGSHTVSALRIVWNGASLDEDEA